MMLYHATLKANLDSINARGIDPEFSQGERKRYLATHRGA